MAVAIKNGKTIDGVTVKLIMGTTVVPCAKVSYGDKLEKEKGARLGQQIVAYKTRGKYDTETVSVEMEDIIWHGLLLPKLPANGFGNATFTITVSGEDPDADPTTSWGSFTDTVDGVTIDSVKPEYTNEAGASMRPIECSCTQVYYNGKTINTRPDAPTTGVANTMKL